MSIPKIPLIFKSMGFLDFLFGKKKKSDQTQEQTAPSEETPAPLAQETPSEEDASSSEKITTEE